MECYQHTLTLKKNLLVLLLMTIISQIKSISGSTDQSNKGINSIFDFSLRNSSWTYQVSAIYNHQKCQPLFHITKDGVLQQRSPSYINDKLCQRAVRASHYSSRVFLTVSVANYLLHANVSFNLIGKASAPNEISSILIKSIQIIPHEKLCNSFQEGDARWTYSPLMLKAFLPTNTILESRVSKLSLYNLYESQTHSIELTDSLMLKLDLSRCPKLRSKRQLFSNLHSPTFDRETYTVSIREEISNGTQVILVTATDADDGSAGAVRYSLHADVDQRSLKVFQIDPISGWVITKARVDRENISSHYFTVKARDQGSPSNSAQTSLTITVEDINDHAPTFEQSVYNINVSETESVGSVIMRIRADDLDVGPNRNIVYSIINAGAVTNFAMDRSTGDISIANKLDRENVANYIFVVKAEDQATSVGDRLSSTVTANVNILDYNDNAPLFSRDNYDFSVREDINVSTGPVIIGEIIATDADYGNNGIIKYSITYGNPYPRVFSIMEDTGQLTVITTLDRDRTGGGEYNLRIKARDVGVPSLSSQVNVKVIVEDVNDNAPSFRYPSYTHVVYEDHTPGVQIAIIQATDPDEGDNKVLTYSILPTSEGERFPFSINRNTGAITNNRTLDREDVDRYDFTVQVVDGGDPPQSTSTDVTLNILDRNDNVPEFTERVYSVMISEDTALQQEVTNVLANDPDENDALTYRITSGDPNNDFLILKEQIFGVIRVNKALSYDRQKYYSLAVQAVDTSGKSSEATVNINVTDKNRHAPVFEETEYTFFISEAAQPGNTIGQVQATDDDVELNGAVTYFFVNNGLPLPFMINNNTGEIIVNDTLDRDNPDTQEFHVDVIASDRGIPRRQTDIPAYVHIFIEDINDNAPVFSRAEYTASISEDKSVGSSVIKVSATDRDKPGTPNSQVRYTFQGGDNGNGSFYVEYAGGTIRVNKTLDRETVSYYDLVVYAIDMSTDNRQSTAVNVKVTILDVNDNAPKFESDVIIRRIYENQRVNSIVSPVIRATDADEGVNAQITFQLVGGDTGAFELTDMGDGSFKLLSKVALDYESLRKNYTLEVQASSQHKITKATVVVKLQDVNDNKPELRNFTIVVNNYRLHFPDGPIGRVPAFDPDETDRANLRYSVKSGNANQANFFTLNATTGFITLNNNLDSDRMNEGEFVVQVTDILNAVNATCKVVYRLITNDMLINSVTLRLDDITAASFMTSMYGYTVQALAEVLRLLPSQIYIIDIKEDTEVDTLIDNPVLNISFAAVREVDGKDVFLSKDHIKEQIYRRLDLLKNLSAVTILPFDDTLCVLEPCLNYQRCSIDLQFDEAASFISSEAMLFRPIRTRSIYSCGCPQGYAGVNESYSCDTEINLCYSDPCLNSGTCMQIEAGYTCICPTGYKGDRCQYETITTRYNESTCPNDVCSGAGSYCIELLKGGFACQQGISRCEETDTQTDTCALRTASFVPGSYLMFPSLKSRARFNIQLSFATRKKSGLLLYNGRYNHQHDFIALELINHTAVFSMSFGDQVYQVSVGKKYGLNDGQWHTVNIDYKEWTMVISLDECDIGLSLANPHLFDIPCAMKLDMDLAKTCLKPQKKDALCTLDVTGPLLLGGLPEYLKIDRLHSNYFVGCIRDFHLNFNHVDLKSAVTDHNTQEGCVYKRDYCINSPCRNQGTCSISWGTYRCSCPSNKAGKDCSIQTTSPYTFYGIGHLQYTSGLGSVRKPWYNSFMFKTTVDNRPLMRIDLGTDKTIEYRLESGYITFRYANFYYIFDEALVNDDTWHHFEMRLLSNSLGLGQLLFQLDYGDIQKSESLDNSLDDLDVLDIWVGGDENTNAQNLGFSGCLKDIRVGTSLSTAPLVPTRRDDVSNGCTKPTRCTEQCPAITSECHIGWEDSTCVCNEGLIGTSCTSVCTTQYNPCQHGARCNIDRSAILGYKCVCPSGYRGIYCDERIETKCAASWWGSPVCGPCSCSTQLNFDSQCNRLTGACVCKTGYYKPAGSEACEPCNCYYNGAAGGALSLSCDQSTGQCQCKEGVDGLRCDTCENEFAEITSKGCQVQYGVCPRAYKSGIWWTRTKFGVKRIEPCPAGSIGNATRICQDNDVGWEETILSGCTSAEFLALNSSLNRLMERRTDNKSIPVYAANSPSYTFLAIDVVSSLRNATQQVGEVYKNDLLMAVKILHEILQREKIGQSFDLTNTKDRYFLENLIHITSDVLKPDLVVHWISVLDSYKPTAISDLLRDFDEYIANLADNMATKFVSGGMSPFQIVSENMVIGMDSVRENGVTIPKYNNVRKPDSLFDDVTSVMLPVQYFNQRSNGDLSEKAVTGYVLYRTAGDLMVQVSAYNRNPYSADIKLNPNTDSASRYGGLNLNSAIFSLVLQQGSSSPSLNEPLELTFQLTDPAQNRNPQCVYLNSTSGQWTGKSCEVKSTEEDRVVCSCSHLSTYALITDYHPNAGALATQIRVHVYVAVAHALFCFLFTLLVFICLKDFKSNYIYNQINLQLCFCVALIVFISGSESYAKEAACTVVAVLLQFFVLSLFAWTFVNALHLYRILTEKRHIDGEAMLLYVMIGYVGPGIVTGLSVGLSPESFGTNLMCWLSVDDTMIWSLAGPALFCCIAVLVLLILSIVNSFQPQDYATTAKKKDAEYFQSAIWISLVLMPLTLCTWLFALLTVNSAVAEHNFFDYFFSTFALVTALVSLLAHVVFNKRGRGELQRRLKRCSGHGPLDDSDLSDNPRKAHLPFSGDFNTVRNPTHGGGLAHLTFGPGSESSTTSNSRLTGAPSDLLGYLKHPPSSTSTSDVHTGSHHRRRRRDTDGSSDSETDSDIRTEREKDIELASSHSSDDDEPIPPVTLGSIKPIVINTQQVPQRRPPQPKPLSPLAVDRSSPHNMQSTPMVNQDMGFAPPPPYFITPNGAQWPRRLSDSTDSTHGSQSKVDTSSLQSTVRNMGAPPPPPPRPNNLSTFTGGRSTGPSTPDKNQMPSPSAAEASPFHHQHTNKSFVNSPSIQEKLVDNIQQPSPAKSDGTNSHQPIHSNSSTLRRLMYDEAPSTSPIPQQRASLTSNSKRGSPLLTNQHRVSPLITNQQTLSPLVTNQHRASPLATPRIPSVDRVRTTETDLSMADGLSISTQSSNQDDVFMPPPPDMAATLTLQPGSGYSTMQRSTNSTIPEDLDDVNNETQV